MIVYFYMRTDIKLGIFFKYKFHVNCWDKEMQHTVGGNSLPPRGEIWNNIPSNNFSRIHSLIIYSFNYQKKISIY